MKRDHFELITRYLDDQLDEREMAELNQLLANDSEVRAEFLEMTGQAFMIADGFPEVVEKQKKVFRFPLMALAAAACVALLIGLIWKSGQEEKAIAKLLEAVGEYELPSKNTLFSGDTVKTIGGQSSLAFEFLDGTILRLAGDTMATITDGEQKRLVVHRGAASLDVTPQPVEFPLMIVTPTAELTVRGTTFSVHAAGAQTELEVAEGAVDFKRLSDGKSVRVDAGQYSVAGDRHEEFLVRLIPEMSEKFALDLRVEPGKLLKLGRAEKNGSGEVTGSREEPSPGGTVGVVLKNFWTSGNYAFFKSAEKSVLKIRLKMEQPFWLNFIALYRSPEPGSTKTETCLYADEAWWKDLKPGEWRTIEIPLRKPHQVEFNITGDKMAPMGWYCFGMSLTSGDEKRGLVIERIWID